jgi:hypothetical protein
LAPVFHWGLNDALRPPFLENKIPVFPLVSPFAGNIINADTVAFLLSEDAEICLLKWNSQVGKIEEMSTLSTLNNSAVPIIKTLYPAQGAKFSLDPVKTKVIFEGSFYKKFMLFVLSEGMLIVDSFSSEKAAGELGVQGSVTRGIPASLFKDGIRLLYSGKIFWFVEARDEKSNVLARSPLMSFELLSDLNKKNKCYQAD